MAEQQKALTLMGLGLPAGLSLNWLLGLSPSPMLALGLPWIWPEVAPEQEGSEVVTKRVPQAPSTPTAARDGHPQEARLQVR